MSIEGTFVSWTSLPDATSTFQMSAFPERDEKKTIQRPSGDQVGWKSPPGPFVSWRVEPSASECS